MAYADSSYYFGTFSGSSVPAESLDKALEFASDLIDGATQYRMQDSGFTTLTTFQQGKIKRACCMIAEDVYAGGHLNGGAVITGFSLGDLSIQPPSGPSLGGVIVRTLALTLLNATGLTYAGGVEWDA